MRALHEVREVTSTNDVARDLAARGAPDGTLVIARSQVAGRGRQGATWFSPPDRNVYLSLVHRSRLTAAQLSGLTLDVALATATAIEDFAGCFPSLKWPNDLLLRGRKVGGILTELHTDLSTDGSPVVIVGVGVNVEVQPQEFPPELAEVATSLLEVTGRSSSPRELALLIGRRLIEKLAGYEAVGGPDLVAYERRFPFVGWRVRVGQGGEATIRRVMADGALGVSFPGWNDIQSIRSGPVTLVGPPEESPS
ncbi:MAG: biotin--[acetyl-CoA-carboxylase] ligase [Deltaproteobacteria bacterium]|nr:biotin--[acetyl-CoA-carboxylase] ligase [Deltaproteobacteria bacterium]MCB9787765.1 biotin--[acetyl-CoA-carboxylase] ligase [Deltaproteobacteria bacterium]